MPAILPIMNEAKKLMESEFRMQFPKLKTTFELSLLAVVLFLSGCTTSSWQKSDMEFASDLTSDEGYNGEIPQSLQDWNFIADVSDIWINCNFDLTLPYMRISIDQQNRVWIYGLDHSNGPVGGITDNPGCSNGNTSRVIIYDPASAKSRLAYPSTESDGFLSSASGWTHLHNDRVLVNSVFIYKNPWDSPDGGKGNQYMDLDILEDGSFRSLFTESSSEFAVPDYTVYENIAYVLFNPVRDGHPELLTFDLDSEILMSRNEITVCENPKSIEFNGDEIFILCEGESQAYSLYVLTKDLSIIATMKDKISFRPNLVNHGNGFPLSIDSKGRVWVGYSYLVDKSNNRWVLNAISPNDRLVEFYDGNYYPKPIFGMIPYKDGMLFSVNGGVFFADYDMHQWEILAHNISPLPIVVDTNGKIYAFTGKYILSSP